MLDRIYRLIDPTTHLPAAAFWCGRAPASAIVTVGEAVDVVGGGSLLYPTTTETIRLRYRADLRYRSAVVDSEGRVWWVNEVGEVGRKRWLDAGVTFYGDRLDAESGEAPSSPGE